MKNLYFFLITQFFLYSGILYSQNRIIKNLPDGGNKYYVAPEVVEFKPGYYFGGTPVQTMTAQIGRVAAIKWEMKQRFGLDDNGNGLIELQNSVSYASATEFEVTCSLDFMAPTPQDFGQASCSNCKTPTNCIWYVNNSTTYKVKNPQDILKPTFLLKDEVTYSIRAELVFEHNGKKIVYFTPNTEVIPNDILIVALGDSYASGEGNPDRIAGKGSANFYPKMWAESANAEYTSARDGLPANAVQVDHAVGHRSTTNWSAIAAMQIERSDPHTSVTYINLASGGSDIEDLIERTHDKGIKIGKHPYIQIDEASRLISGRKIEILAMVIGGNNLGFKSAITSYILPGRELGDITLSILSGNWDVNGFTHLADYRMDEIEWEHVSGLIKLPGKYDMLDQKISLFFPKLDKVYVMQYPEIWNGCSEVFNKELWLNMYGKINSDEIKHGQEYLLQPLNTLIKEKCAQYGWIALNPGNWTNHGACKPLPSILQFTPDKPGFHQTIGSGIFPKIDNFSSGISWCNDFPDSQWKQDDDLGVAHPNGLGHLAMAESFLSVVAPNNTLATNQVSINRMHGDFNGDKQPDMLYFGKKGAAVALSGNFNLQSFGSWLTADSGNEDFWTVGDFNGDGKDDILATYSGVGVKVFLSDGYSFQYGGVWTTAGTGSEQFWTVGDFDGDGRDDILRSTSAGVQVLKSTGYSFNDPDLWSAAGYGNLGFWTVGDFDGDSRDDILRIFQGTEVLKSTGKKFESPATWGAHPIDPVFISTNKGLILGDFNNDKKTDFAQMNLPHGFKNGKPATTCKFEVALSNNGSIGNFQPWYSQTTLEIDYPYNSTYNAYRYLSGDFTGDKITDILVDIQSGNKFLISSDKTKFDLDKRWH